MSTPSWPTSSTYRPGLQENPATYQPSIRYHVDQDYGAPGESYRYNSLNAAQQIPTQPYQPEPDQIHAYTQTAPESQIDSNKKQPLDFNVEEVIDNSPGEYLGCSLVGHPDLDWKPVALRKWPLLVLTAICFALGCLMIGLWWMATYKPLLVGTNDSKYFGVSALWIFPGLFLYEIWYLVDRGTRQTFPYFNLVGDDAGAARDTILAKYYPTVPVLFLYHAIRRKHWMVVITSLALLLCSVVIAFQATLMNSRTVVVASTQSFLRLDTIEPLFVPFLGSSFGEEIVRAGIKHLTTTVIGTQSLAEQSGIQAEEFAVIPFVNSTGYFPVVGEIWSCDATVLAGYLDCTPAALSVNNQVSTITDSDGCDLEIKGGLSTESSYYWGVSNSTSLPCMDRQFFGYGALKENGDVADYVAISCSGSLYHERTKVRIDSTVRSLISSTKPGKFTPYISDSLYDKAARSVLNNTANNVIAKTLKSALFDPGLARSPFWFTYTVPGADPIYDRTSQIDSRVQNPLISPSSISDLQYMAHRAYRRAVSHMIYQAILASLAQISGTAKTTVDGETYTFPYLYSVIPENAMILSVAYFLLSVIALSIVIVRNRPKYRFSGLKADPSTLLYQMTMICKSKSLRDCFRGLEWTAGEHQLQTQLLSKKFRLGYWRVGSGIDYKLECVGAESHEQDTIDKDVSQKISMLSALALLITGKHTSRQAIDQQLDRRIPTGSVPWQFNMFIYTFIMVFIIGLFVFLIAISLINGPLPNFYIPSNLSSGPVFGTLSYTDLLWRPAVTILWFILFKVWFQGILLTLAIHRPFSDLYEKKTWKSLRRNCHVTPMNPLGRPIRRFFEKPFGGHLQRVLNLPFGRPKPHAYERGNGFVILPILSANLFIFFGWNVFLFVAIPQINLVLPQQFTKPVPFLSVPELQFSSMDDTLALAYHKAITGERLPQFTTRLGYYSPFQPVGDGDTRFRRQGSLNFWSGPSDVFWANLTDCNVLDNSELVFRSKEALAGNTQVLEFGTGQLNITGCKILGDPLTFCPATNVTTGELSYYFTGACGSWRLIGTTEGSRADCPLADYWLFHEVTSTSTPTHSSNGSTIFPAESILSSESIACLPRFWILRDTTARVLMESNTVINGDSSSLEETIYNILEYSTPLFSPGDETKFRSEYNARLNESLQRSTLPDEFNGTGDIPSRLTQYIAQPGLDLQARSLITFLNIYSLYLAKSQIFWPRSISKFTAVIDGHKILTVNSVLVQMTAIGLIFGSFLIFFALTFPFSKRVRKYKIPRPLNSIANYLTYFYSSPLLREMETVVKADMTYKTVGWNLEGVLGGSSRYSLREITDPLDPSNTTYTIARAEGSPPAFANNQDYKAGYLPAANTIHRSYSQEQLPLVPLPPPAPTI